MDILSTINSYLEEHDHMIVAIDGRCASGKTTLASKLQEEIISGNVSQCNVIHMDDFFLQPEQRTAARLNEPGGNVDYERFIIEVMQPLYKHQPFSYRPFSCQTQMLKPPISVTPAKVTIIEGAYSCHPKLWDYYDLHVFMTIDPVEQLKRIEVRNGSQKLQMFKDKWIPFEEKYFKAFYIEKRCDISI